MKILEALLYCLSRFENPFAFRVCNACGYVGMAIGSGIHMDMHMAALACRKCKVGAMLKVRR